VALTVVRFRFYLTVGLAVVLTAGLAACSVNPEIDLKALDPAAEPQVALDTPFFPQTEYQCGPAALATVLVDSGVDTTPDALSPEVYLPGKKGSLQIELMAASRRHGRIPFVLPTNVSALLAEVQAGRPVLLLQNLGTRSVPTWHYSVLTGYNLTRNLFFLNNGAEQGARLDAPTLLRTWDWGGNWALVALGPGDFPVTGTKDDVARYLQAVADFEAVAGGDAAAVAWEVAAQRWPAQPEPLLALGNHAYSEHRLFKATDWYARGLEVAPGDVVLANNLASVLGELGCAREGEAVLKPIAANLARGSAWRKAVNDTLAELGAQVETDGGGCAAVVSGLQGSR